MYFRLALGRLGNAGEQFQQSAFAGPVASDHAQNLALPDLKGNVSQRPDMVFLLVMVAAVEDARYGVAQGMIALLVERADSILFS